VTAPSTTPAALAAVSTVVQPLATETPASVVLRPPLPPASTASRRCRTSCARSLLLSDQLLLDHPAGTCVCSCSCGCIVALISAGQHIGKPTYLVKIGFGAIAKSAPVLSYRCPASTSQAGEQAIRASNQYNGALTHRSALSGASSTHMSPTGKARSFSPPMSHTTPPASQTVSILRKTQSQNAWYNCARAAQPQSY
jgi:hypothetical protein